MRTIGLDRLQDLDNIPKLHIEDIKQINKYKSKIIKKLQQDWKYGSSWIDVWFLKWDIKRLNKVLDKYSVKVMAIDSTED
jgi:hypothetical protein